VYVIQLILMRVEMKFACLSNLAEVTETVVVISIV